MNISMSKRSGILGRILFGILGAACLFGPQAQATFIVTIDQVGTDVVVTGTGTIDLTGLTVSSALGHFTSGMIPSSGVLGIGSPTLDPVTIYTGFSGPAAFGSGGTTIPSDSGSGDKVAITQAFNNQLAVPQGYVSGNLLSDSSTYNNETFARLGITPGTYIWTWGSGANADSFIINAVGSVPDAGSTLMLLLIAASLMFLATCRSCKLISKH